MGIHVIKTASPTGIANAGRLKEWFSKQRGIRKPIYYILPSNKWLHAARLLQPGISFKTFDDLADLILKAQVMECGERKKPFTYISEGERRSIIQQIHRSQLPAGSADWEEAGHAAKTYADTYGQLKRMGLGLEELPSEFSAMLPCLEEYEKVWVQGRRWLDPENRILEAAAAMPSLSSLDIQEVVIDGYYDLSALQYLMLEALVRYGVPVTFYLPEMPGEPILQETEAFLSGLGFRKECENVPTLPSHRKQYIFQATTVEEEIHGVLSMIQDLAVREGYEQTAVVLPQDKPYRAELMNIAKQLNVPIKLPQKALLSETMLVQFLKRWMEQDPSRTGKWERLADFDAWSRILFLDAHTYMDWKRRLLAENADYHEFHPDMSSCWSIRKALPSQGSMLDYVDQILFLFEEMGLEQVWKSRILDAPAETAAKIALEWKGYQLLDRILRMKKEQLEKAETDGPIFHLDIFSQWLFDTLEGEEIFMGRAPARGVSVYSLREAALFRGKNVIVLGMNEGMFPQAHRLLGYFQESHLTRLPLAFAKPDADTFGKKQDALFRQLFYVAECLYFTYVAGKDSAHPLLPSKYIGKHNKFKQEQWKLALARRYPVARIKLKQFKKRKGLAHSIRRFSTHGRLAKSQRGKPICHSSQDQLEKWAYHAGLGFAFDSLPEQLSQTSEVLARLQQGMEHVELPDWKIRQEAGLSKAAITELEAYAACPFRYLMERSLRISEPEAKQSRLDRRLTGTMFHRFMERFYRSLGLIDKPFSHFQQQQLQDLADSKLVEIFEQEWQRVQAAHPELPDVELELEKEMWLKSVRKWWSAEKERFWERGELALMRIFSLEEEISIPFEVDGKQIELQGKCDRIDVDDDGFAVYDYKTGQASMRIEEEVRKGLKLQIPLYLYGMEKKLGRKENFEPHGGTYVSLGSPGSRASNGIWRDSPDHLKRFGIHSRANKLASLKGEDMMGELGLKDTVAGLWRGMLGDYSVKPLNCSSYCSYKAICRVTEDQIEKAGES